MNRDEFINVFSNPGSVNKTFETKAKDKYKQYLNDYIAFIPEYNQFVELFIMKNTIKKQSMEVFRQKLLDCLFKHFKLYEEQFTLSEILSEPIPVKQPEYKCKNCESETLDYNIGEWTCLDCGMVQLNLPQQEEILTGQDYERISFNPELSKRQTQIENILTRVEKFYTSLNKDIPQNVKHQILSYLNNLPYQQPLTFDGNTKMYIIKFISDNFEKITEQILTNINEHLYPNIEQSNDLENEFLENELV